MTMPVKDLAALIELGGATVGAIVQWFVAHSAIRSETERLHQERVIPLVLKTQLMLNPHFAIFEKYL